MCKLKSMIVLKDRIYCPDHDHHQQMLEELGIEDNYLGASKTFVRVELSPANDDITIPVDKWLLRIDQDITPEWFDVGVYGDRIYETVKAWAAEHIHTSGVVEEISAGIHFVGGSAAIKSVGGSATILAPQPQARIATANLPIVWCAHGLHVCSLYLIECICR